MQLLSKRRMLLTALVAYPAIFGLCQPARATEGEYRLRPGDTVEIAVVGLPDMRQRLTLDVDGQISVPMVGPLRAADSTARELAGQLEKALPAGLGRGTRSERAIETADIVVNVVEYAPVYVNGDVTRPGENRFRPGLTVRGAIALAGGYEVMRYRLVDPVLLSSDLGAEYQSLWVEQAAEQVHLARLEAELKEKGELDAAPSPAPLPRQFVTDLVENEAQQLTLRRDNLLKEKDFLEQARVSATKQLDELTEQREKEKEGVLSDTAELQRLVSFSEKGNVTANRVVEQRRSMLLSSTRLLQTEAQITQITRERDGYARQIQRLDQGTKIDLLKEIQTSTAKLASINARLLATANKIEYAGTMRSQLALRTDGRPSLLIVRKDGQSTVRLNAEEDTPLEPGDVVEISLKMAAPTNDGEKALQAPTSRLDPGKPRT